MLGARRAVPNDYYKKHIELFANSDFVDPQMITFGIYEEYVTQGNIYVIEWHGIILGSISVMFEQKLSGKVAHISDLMIANNATNQRLDIILVNHAINIARQERCYKIMVHCLRKDQGIFSSCGFQYYGVAMQRELV